MGSEPPADGTWSLCCRDINDTYRTSAARTCRRALSPVTSTATVLCTYVFESTHCHRLKP